MPTGTDPSSDDKPPTTHQNHPPTTHTHNPAQSIDERSDPGDTSAHDGANVVAPGYDPLADHRTPTSPTIDLFVWGSVFLDIVFAGLAHPPTPGTEVFAEGMASCPGGIANMAVAASRLNLNTSLSAAFSDDDYGDFCYRTLSEQEGVDLSFSRRFPDWHSPVTVSISVDGDRQMITHAHPSPLSSTAMIERPPTARTVLISLHDRIEAGADSWIDQMAAGGAKVFASIGCDPEGSWPRELLDQVATCDAFVANRHEALACTDTTSVESALYALADRVSLAVVTNAGEGSMAVDASTGEEARVPAIAVDAVDPTGAGDVFTAALITTTLAEWPLARRLAFANLCAALAISQFGGSLAAPTWGDVTDWWQRLGSCDRTDAYHRSLRRRYEFLDDIAPLVSRKSPRRATATIAARSDVDGLR